MIDDNDRQTQPLKVGRTIGYARVSKEQQNLNLQLDALETMGCDVVYQDKVSGVDFLPEQAQALKALRPGDTFVVWRIDRLGRKTGDLLGLMEWFNQNEIEFVSTTQQIDTRTPTGRLMFAMNAAYAENEREQLIERTTAGLKSARKRGRVGGRPKSLTDAQKAEIKALVDADVCSITEVCARYKISRTTYFRAFRGEKETG
ncbi:recombinase family protein [Salinicola sp. NYA28a]